MDIKDAILKRKEFIFLFIIIVIFCLFVLCKLSNHSLSSKIRFMNYETQNWEEMYINLAINYPLEINNNLLIMDIAGNVLKINDLLKIEEHTIIFRYNERSCQPCLYEEMNTIKNGINIGYNIVLLCNFNKYSDFIDFCRVNQFEGKAYLIKDGSYSENGNEDRHIPYYCRFKFNKYKGCYVPNKDNSELTVRWFGKD